MRERRLVLLGEGGKIGLEANQKSKEGAPGTGDKRIEVSKLEEVADQTDATTAAKDKGQQSREDDATQDAVTRGGTKEGVDGIVGGGREVAKPVIESGMGDVDLLGKLASGSRLGLGEVIESVEDLGARPTERDWAGRVRGSRLKVEHGSSPGAVSWQSHCRVANHVRLGAVFHLLAC